MSVFNFVDFYIYLYKDHVTSCFYQVEK